MKTILLTSAIALGAVAFSKAPASIALNNTPCKSISDTSIVPGQSGNTGSSTRTDSAGSISTRNGGLPAANPTGTANPVNQMPGTNTSPATRPGSNLPNSSTQGSTPSPVGGGTSGSTGAGQTGSGTGTSNGSTGSGSTTR